MSVAVAVVIPVHDAEDTLAEQLAFLATQVGAPAFEVVVALNRCTDRSREVAESFGDQLRLTVIDADARMSAAHARNAGAAATTASLLLFCDADDHVGQGWVAAMVGALRPGVDFVAGRIEVDRADLPDWIYDLRYRRIDGTCIQWSGDVAYALGASFACRRDAFDAVGGFDELFERAGGEEIDLAARLARAGRRIGEAPDAVVRYRPRSTIRGVVDQVRTYDRGYVLLAAKQDTLRGPRTRRGVALVVIKRVGFLVVRERERRPHVVLFNAVRTMFRADAARRYLRDGSGA